MIYLHFALTKIIKYVTDLTQIIFLNVCMFLFSYMTESPPTNNSQPPTTDQQGLEPQPTTSNGGATGSTNETEALVR